jgi:hypothetical protein
MKFLYIIKSCDSYYSTRFSFIKDGWIRKINSDSDYVVITSSIEDEKTYRCNCSDTYISTAEKVRSFLNNYQFEGYDWYFLIDDDVFVFPEKLENYINEKNIESDSPTIIANVNCYFSEMKEDSFCGGAGVLMTKKTISLFKNFISEDNESCGYGCDDCFLFCISKKLELNIINNSPGDSSYGLFIPTDYKEQHAIRDRIDKCVLLHMIRSESEHKELYKKFYE